jgi:hypothetical protein
MKTKSNSVGPAQKSAPFLTPGLADRSSCDSPSQLCQQTLWRLQDARPITCALLRSLLLTTMTLPVLAANQFVQVTSPGWTNSSQNSWTGAWGDYDNDGFVDLFVPNMTASGGSWTNLLYRNNGDRTFTRMTNKDVGPMATFSAGGAATCADYDDEGWGDVFCPNNSGQSKLFHNDGTGRFVAVTNVVFDSYVATGAWGDYDNDGRLDLFVPSYPETRVVYRNLGGGQFERAAIGQIIQGAYVSVSWTAPSWTTRPAAMGPTTRANWSFFTNGRSCPSRSGSRRSFYQ